MSIFRDVDLAFYFPLLAAALGAAYTLAGQIADAGPLLTRAMEQSTATEVVTFQALCRLSLGEAHMLAGRLAEAYAFAEQALALARMHQERGHEVYALRLLGEIAARRESRESDQARDHYRQALALAEELGMRPLMAHCHLDLGTLYATIGRRAEARTALSAAVELYRTMEMMLWLPQAEAALAQVT
jgi:tetratricopeptide (TPR) repeat protein